MLSYEPLQKLLSERGMTLMELSKRGGFSSRTLAKVNKGDSVNVDTLDRICNLLGVPIEKVVEILGENGNKLV